MLPFFRLFVSKRWSPPPTGGPIWQSTVRFIRRFSLRGKKWHHGHEKKKLWALLRTFQLLGYVHLVDIFFTYFLFWICKLIKLFADWSPITVCDKTKSEKQINGSYAVKLTYFIIVSYSVSILEVFFLMVLQFFVEFYYQVRQRFNCVYFNIFTYAFFFVLFLFKQLVKLQSSNNSLYLL